MKIHAEHQTRLKGFFIERQFREALDFLMGLKSEYQRDTVIFRAPYYVDVARCYSAIGDYKQADQYFDLAFGTISNYAFARIIQTESFLQRGQFSRTQDSLMAMLNTPHLADKVKKIAHFYQVAGNFFKLTGDYVQAKDCFEQGVKLVTQRGSLHKDLERVTLVLMHAQPNPVAGMVEFVKLLRKRDRDSAELGYSSSMAVTFLNNRLRDPVTSFEEMTCHTLLSKCYMESGNTARARAHLDQAHAIDSDNLDVAITDIMFNLYTKNILAARKVFNQHAPLLLAAPKKAISLASAFLQAGDHEVGGMLANSVLANTYSPDAARRTACSILSDIYGSSRAIK